MLSSKSPPYLKRIENYPLLSKNYVSSIFLFCKTSWVVFTFFNKLLIGFASSIGNMKKKQTSLNGRLRTLLYKRSFRPQFGPQNFFVGFSSAKSQTFSQAAILCNVKDPIWGTRIFFHGFTSTSSQTMFQGIILCNLEEN